MAQLSILIPDEQISSAVMEIVKKMNLVPADDLKGITWDIDEFRKLEWRDESGRAIAIKR